MRNFAAVLRTMLLFSLHQPLLEVLVRARRRQALVAQEVLLVGRPSARRALPRAPSHSLKHRSLAGLRARVVCPSWPPGPWTCQGWTWRRCASSSGGMQPQSVPKTRFADQPQAAAGCRAQARRLAQPAGCRWYSSVAPKVNIHSEMNWLVEMLYQASSGTQCASEGASSVQQAVQRAALGVPSEQLHRGAQHRVGHQPQGEDVPVEAPEAAQRTAGPRRAPAGPRTRRAAWGAPAAWCRAAPPTRRCAPRPGPPGGAPRRWPR